MSDQAGKKQGNIGAGKIGWVEKESAGMEIIACMVQRHNDHDNPPQQVDRMNAFAFNR